MILILIALLATPAHANWFKRLCAFKLVRDDPYQYESVTEDWLNRAMIPLETREKWGTITPIELHVLEQLRAERRKRDVVTEIIERHRVDDVQQFVDGSN